MAATAHCPEIQLGVYASFPRMVALGAELNLESDNWHWVHCLTLPLETLNILQFSPRPHKWIRYAIGILVGAEGDLSSSSDSLNIVDYNAGLPAESAALYYYTGDDERRRMFPLDPKIVRSEVTSSVVTSRAAQFLSNAADRDGNKCVLTGMKGSYCDAVHLLTRSKGDTYISTYTERRSRDPASGDLIRDIDCVRNGLLLNKLTHVMIGKNVAFLPTPNFAMNTADVDPTAPPEEKRYTAHLFEPSDPWCLGSLGHPSGTPLRISDTPDWPPTILFDAVYASAVLHHFGTQTLKDVVTATWVDVFDPDAGYKSTTDIRAFAKEKRVQERQARYEARTEPDTFDMLLALPYILVPRNELQATLREAKEKAVAEEQKRVQEKVDAWNRKVDTS